MSSLFVPNCGSAPSSMRKLQPINHFPQVNPQSQALNYLSIKPAMPIDPRASLNRLHRDQDDNLILHKITVDTKPILPQDKNVKIQDLFLPFLFIFLQLEGIKLAVCIFQPKELSNPKAKQFFNPWITVRLKTSIRALTLYLRPHLFKRWITLSTG